MPGRAGGGGNRFGDTCVPRLWRVRRRACTRRVSQQVISLSSAAPNQDTQIDTRDTHIASKSRRLGTQIAAHACAQTETGGRDKRQRQAADRERRRHEWKRRWRLRACGERQARRRAASSKLSERGVADRWAETGGKWHMGAQGVPGSKAALEIWGRNAPARRVVWGWRGSGVSRAGTEMGEIVLAEHAEVV